MDCTIHIPLYGYFDLRPMIVLCTKKKKNQDVIGMLMFDVVLRFYNASAPLPVRSKNGQTLEPSYITIIQSLFERTTSTVIMINDHNDGTTSDVQLKHSPRTYKIIYSGFRLWTRRDQPLIDCPYKPKLVHKHKNL